MEITNRRSGSADRRSANEHRPGKQVDARCGRHGAVRYSGEPLSVASDGTPSTYAGDAGAATAKTGDDARRGPAHGDGTVVILGMHGGVEGNRGQRLRLSLPGWPRAQLPVWFLIPTRLRHPDAPV